MKTIIIISWVVMVLAVVFYFVSKYRAKKKSIAVMTEQLSENDISLDELQQLLNQRGDD